MSAQSFPTTRLACLSVSNSPIHALTFSSGSGQYLLTGSQDRSIRLHNPLTTKLIQTYSAHGYEVLDLCISDDNARFVSGGGDKTVFLWDVATAQTLRRFQGHVGRVEAVMFGGEGDGVVVSGSYDGSVKVWDAKSRSDKAIMTFTEAKDSVSCVAVRGHEIYAGSVDGRVRIYDLAMGCVETDVLGTSVTSVTPTLAGDSYLVSTLDSKMRLMDRPSGKCLQTFMDPEFQNETYRLRSTLGMGDSVAFSGGEDGRVFVWDVLTGEVVERVWHKRDGGDEKGGGGVGSKGDAVSAVAWNQVRRIWASAGGDGEVVVWGKGD